MSNLDLVTPRELELKTLLAEYVREYPDERRAVSRMQSLLESTVASAPGSALRRDHYTPGHFTASAFVVSPAKDEVLLIYHRKLLLWLQPGGHIEAEDARLIDAAQRELSEETQVDAAPLLGGALFDIDIHLIPARKTEPEHQHFDLRFLFAAGARRIQAASDALDARWLGRHELNSIASDDSVMRAVSKLPSRAD